MHSKPAVRSRMSNWFRPALLAAAFALCAVPAHAQQSDLAGTWGFRAAFKAADCTMDGQATLTPARAPGVYNVRMRATETCSGEVRTTAEETCIATQSGQHVSLRCTVVSVTPASGYLPDDFELERVGGDRMQGVLTANWNAPAIWRRLDNNAPVA